MAALSPGLIARRLRWREPAIYCGEELALSSSRWVSRASLQVYPGIGDLMDFTRLGTLTLGILATALPSRTARAATEQPTYTVVERSGGVELRQYSPRLVAETTVRGDEVSARNQGFRVIADYIFGANQGRANIAMDPAADAAQRGRATDRGAVARGISPTDRQAGRGALTSSSSRHCRACSVHPV